MSFSKFVTSLIGRRCVLFFLALLMGVCIPHQTAFASAPNAKTYAVETREGVPFFTIDSVPTRARIFFGISNNEPIVITPEYAHYEYEFVALNDAQGMGTLHFRFGPALGEINLDNISVVDKETGANLAKTYDFEDDKDYSEHWQTWHEVFEDQRIASVMPADGAGTAGSRGLQIKILHAPEGKSPDFHLFHDKTLDFVQGRTYVVSFDARASALRRTRVSCYRPASPLFIPIGHCGKNVLESQVRLAATAGVNFVSFPYPGIWPDANGALDFDKSDEFCDLILEANPNAILIPRISLRPTLEWLNQYPEAREIWRDAGADSDGQGWDWPTLNSEIYCKTANETLASIVKHLEERYGDSIAGYHPCGQNTSEWFTPNTWSAGSAGFAEVDRLAFQKWLKRKYGDVVSLRQVWNDPEITFETADVPSVEERNDSQASPYLKPGRLLDFNEFWQTGATNVICELARTVKRETQGKKLAFFFYGYSYEFASVAKGPAASGHYALRELLDCPDVDVICSPISYSERALGGGCSCMLNAESVTAAGKIYLYEDDCRTYIAHALGERLSSVETPEDSVNIVLRNSSETAERNFATWLMDLGAGGWYDSPEIWNAVAKLAPMDQYFLDHPTPYYPEIGVFLSERSMLKITSGKYTGTPVAAARAQFNRVGAPYAQYDLADLVSGVAPILKLTVILNADALDADELDALERLEKSGKTTIARYALVGPTTAELRKLAQEAGVWLYTERACNVWANGPFVTLHAPEDGEYRFHAPKDVASIVDFIAGETVAEGPDCVFKLKTGDTKVLQLIR